MWIPCAGSLEAPVIWSDGIFRICHRNELTYVIYLFKYLFRAGYSELRTPRIHSIYCFFK